MIKNKTILIILPHLDNETPACGGTVGKHVYSGDHVTYCIVTTAYKPDWSDKCLEMTGEQIAKVAIILGICEVIEPGYCTVKHDTILQKDITETFSRVVNEVQPDVVYIPYKGDLHRDHRLIFESALVAMRLVNCSVKKFLANEPLSETEWGQPIEPFIPTFYSNITHTSLQKIKALKAYETGLKVFPHPRSREAIEPLAKKCGIEI